MIPIYKTRFVKDPVCDTGRDGAKLVSYVDASGNPAQHLLGGWSDAGSEHTFNEHYYTTDNWVTKTKLTNAPWSTRHNFGCEVNPFDNKIYVWLGDGTGSSFAKDVWKFDWVNGWVLAASDYGGGNRQGYVACMDDKYAYVINGYVAYETTSATSNIYRALLTNMTAWQLLNVTPAADISNGALVYHKGKLFFIAGAKRNFIPPHTMSTKVFMSKDHGETWTEVADLSWFNSGLWGNAYSTGDLIIYNSGSDANDSKYANRRMLASEDGINWFMLTTNINPTHAIAMTLHQGDMYMGTGYHNLTNMYREKRISQPYNLVSAP